MKPSYRKNLSFSELKELKNKVFEMAACYSNLIKVVFLDELESSYNGFAGLSNEDKQEIIEKIYDFYLLDYNLTGLFNEDIQEKINNLLEEKGL